MEEQAQVVDGPKAVQVRFPQVLFSAIEGWRREQVVIARRAR